MATVLIRDFDDDLLDTVKEIVGEKTNTKAVISAVQLAVDLNKTLFQERKRADRLAEQLRVRNETVEQMRGACVQLLEISGQGDLIDDSH